MDVVQFAERIFRVIREKKEQIIEITMQGVEDYEKYKYMVGQLHGLESIERELQEILKREEERE